MEEEVILDQNNNRAEELLFQINDQVVTTAKEFLKFVLDVFMNEDTK